MARYLYQGRYNDDGCRGIVAEGGSGREAETRELFAMLGGEVETYLFAVGPDFDFVIIAEMPDTVAGPEPVDLPDPRPGTGQLVLDVRACGICGSDLHEFEADTMSTYATPVVSGHEFRGVVRRVGEGVDTVSVGQRVAVE